MKKNKVIISFDISTSNTGVSVYYENKYYFYEFSSKKMPLLKNGKVSKSKSKGIFDVRIFAKHIYQIKEKYKDKDIYIIYATFVTNTNFNTVGSLYKMVGILELVFGKENIIERYESSARSNLGITNRVKKRYDSEINCTNKSCTPRKKCTSCKQIRRQFLKEEAIKELEEDLGITKSDDIADSYIMLKDYLKELKEDIPL